MHFPGKVLKCVSMRYQMHFYCVWCAKSTKLSKLEIIIIIIIIIIIKLIIIIIKVKNIKIPWANRVDPVQAALICVRLENAYVSA